jgi:large subunit ribosomal protein L9
MPKTEVILTKQIVGLGAESDQVKVAAGYARNYLFPQGIAIPVSGGNKRRLEVLRQRRAEREAHEFNTMSELAKSITKLTCLIKVKTGDDGRCSAASPAAPRRRTQPIRDLLDKRRSISITIKATGDYEIDCASIRKSMPN